ncbi:MAG: ImmA/IrrE family metallo-endopeptidase, partial [Vicinamibacteria bacterium]
GAAATTISTKAGTSPESVGGRDYDDRHSLRRAAEGFALPAMTFAPAGGNVRVEWSPIDLERQSIKFTERGVAHVATQDFCDSVAQFLRAVVKRLHEFEITGTLLEDEFDAISNATPDEEEFCAAAAALGLEPYAIIESDANRIVTVAKELPTSVLLEFFAVAEFARLQEQAAQVLRGIEVTRSNNADLEPLKHLKKKIQIPLANQRPWAQGYEYARALRQHLGIDGVKLSSMSSLGNALQVDDAELEKAVSFVLTRDAALDAVMQVNERNSPGFALAAPGGSAALFALCRALFEYLIAVGEQALIVTRSRSERQKRNRAFAAEFLVPAAILRDVLPRPVLTDEDVDDLAEQFGVNASVIRHQVENHSLASITDKYEWG